MPDVATTFLTEKYAVFYPLLDFPYLQKKMANNHVVFLQRLHKKRNSQERVPFFFTYSLAIPAGLSDRPTGEHSCGDG